MAANEPKYAFLAAVCGLGFSLWAGTVAVATNLIIQRIAAVETEVSAGVLPRADERIRVLEQDHRAFREDIEEIRGQIAEHRVEDH